MTTIDQDVRDAVQERLALALRALDAGEAEDASEWIKRAQNHLRWFAGLTDA